MYKLSKTNYPARSRQIQSLLLHVLIIICFFYLWQDVSAQQEIFPNGFIITNSGDSLKGRIEGFMKDQHSKKIWFTTETGKKKGFKDYTPFDISAFGNKTGSARYVSAAIPFSEGSEMYFVRELIEGEYDVFYYKLESEDHILIQNRLNVVTDLTYKHGNNSDIFKNKRLTDEEFTALLNRVFSDEPEILARISRTRPAKMSIVDLIADYHDVTGKTYRTFGVKNTGFSAGVTAGLTADFLSVKVNRDYVRSSLSVSPNAGFYMSVFSRVTGTGFLAESTVSYKSFHYSYNTTDQDLTRYCETFLKTIFLNNKLGFNYISLDKNKITPFFGMGGNAAFFISPKYDNYTDILNTEENSVSSDMNHDNIQSSSYYGVFIKPGIDLKIKTGNVLKITAEYTYSMGKGSERLSMAGISLMYQFKLN